MADLYPSGDTLTLTEASPTLTISDNKEYTVTGDTLALAGNAPLVIADFTTLKAIVATMDAGEWVQITNSSADNILYTQAEIDAIEAANPTSIDMWGTIGSRAVIEDWSGSAWDGKNMYFMGCGHSDYGGNELYKYDFAGTLGSSSWSRLSTPQPLTELHGNEPLWPTCKIPAVGPIAQHTYSNLVYHPGNNSVWLCKSGKFAYDPTGARPEVAPANRRISEWDITGEEWIDHYHDDIVNRYGSSVYQPSYGEIVVSNALKLGEETWGPWGFDIAGALSRRNALAAAGNSLGTSVYNSNDGLIYQNSSFYQGIVTWAADTDPLTYSVILQATVPQKLLDQNPNTSEKWVEGGFALDEVHNTIAIWNGGRTVWIYDIDTKLFTEHGNLDSTAGPDVLTTNKWIHNKWVYIPEADCYVGLTDADEDIWVYKLTDSSGGPPNTELMFREVVDTDELFIGIKGDTYSYDATNPPVAVNQNFIVTGDTNIIQAPGILTDCTYSTVSAITPTNPANANITIDTGLTGKFTVEYTGTTYPGAVIFQYTITDENGTSNSANVEVIVNEQTFTPIKRLLTDSGVIVDEVYVN